MPFSKTLIDAATAKGYTQAAIARELGVERAFISMVKIGIRRFSPQQAALLAGMSGSDALHAVELATIEGEENPARRAKIMEILGKAIAAGVAAMCLFSYSGDSNSATVTPRISNSELTEYTLYFSKLRRWSRTAATKSKRVPLRNFLTKTFRKILQRPLVSVFDGSSVRAQPYRGANSRT